MVEGFNDVPLVTHYIRITRSVYIIGVCDALNKRNVEDAIPYKTPSPQVEGKRLVRRAILHQLIKQSVVCAVPDQLAVASFLYTDIHIPFRVGFHHDELLPRRESHKGNVMLLCHRVV